MSKIALITGANKGIGRALTEKMLNENFFLSEQVERVKLKTLSLKIFIH